MPVTKVKSKWESDGSLTFTAGTTDVLKIDATNSSIDFPAGLSIDGSPIVSEAEFQVLDAVTAGTVAASKAVVVDANKDIASFRNMTATGTVTVPSVVTASGDGVVYASAPLTIVADANAHDTAIVVPAGAVIEAVYVDVTTQEATGGTKTVSIGVKGGSGTGFLNAVSVASAGTIKGTLVNTGQTLGALLSVDESGAGVLVPEPYVCAAATTVNYTLGSNDFAELVARVIVKYSKIG